MRQPDACLPAFIARPPGTRPRACLPAPRGPWKRRSPPCRRPSRSPAARARVQAAAGAVPGCAWAPGRPCRPKLASSRGSLRGSGCLGDGLGGVAGVEVGLAVLNAEVVDLLPEFDQRGQQIRRGGDQQSVSARSSGDAVLVVVALALAEDLCNLDLVVVGWRDDAVAAHPRPWG